jgi:hypothetical protein
LVTRPIRIRLRTVPVGTDLAVLITGGREHIGAVATAYREGDRVKVETHVLPGHREGDLAAEMARLAALSLKCTVTVAMGIHQDEATREEIDEIVRTVRRLMEEEVRRRACGGAEGRS